MAVFEQPAEVRLAVPGERVGEHLDGNVVHRVTAAVEERAAVDLAEAALSDAAGCDLVALAGDVAAENGALLEKRHPLLLRPQIKQVALGEGRTRGVRADDDLRRNVR